MINICQNFNLIITPDFYGNVVYKRNGHGKFSYAFAKTIKHFVNRGKTCRSKFLVAFSRYHEGHFINNWTDDRTVGRTKL